MPPDRGLGVAPARPRPAPRDWFGGFPVPQTVGKARRVSHHAGVVIAPRQSRSLASPTNRHRLDSFPTRRSRSGIAVAVLGFAGLGLSALGSACSNGVGFDGGSGVTEYFVDNQSSVELEAEWVVSTEGTTADDGSETIAAATRTILTSEIGAGGAIEPSMVFVSFTLRRADDDAIVYEVTTLDDARWTPDEGNGDTYSSFDFVVTDADLGG